MNGLIAAAGLGSRSANPGERSDKVLLDLGASVLSPRVDRGNSPSAPAALGTLSTSTPLVPAPGPDNSLADTLTSLTRTTC